MKSSQRPPEFEQNNYDVTSTPGYVFKKNSSRGAKHGPSERQKNVLPSETDAEKRLVRKSTEATQRYLRDGTPAKRSETRCQDFGWKEKDMMLFD